MRDAIKFFVCSLAVLVAAGELCAIPTLRKKCIAFGWEYHRLTPEQILANAGKFKDTAIDGVEIYLKATNRTGKVFDTSSIMSEPEWDIRGFDGQIPVLREISKTEHLSESFLNSFRAPKKRVPWTDDAGWACIAHNMGVVGQLSRMTGLKGICVDPEDYYKQKQFVRAEGDPPYDELVKIARRRGREVFGALFREQPEARVLFYWFLTSRIEYFLEQDPLKAAKENGDVWPAFADGILDVIPPNAVIIDGDEYAYGYASDGNCFQLSACRQRQIAPLLLSPENRAKHAVQVQVSFGYYLDYYTGKYGGSPSFKPVNGSMTERFRRNYIAGGRVADEYVWLWGETMRTINWENANVQKHIPNRRWCDALPGMYGAMSDLNSADYGRSRRKAELERCGELKDLNPNPGFKPDEGGDVYSVPSAYTAYKGNGKTSMRLTDKDGDGDGTCLAMVAQGRASGNVIFHVNGVAAGDVYMVSCRAKGGSAFVKLAWQDEKGWQWGLGNYTMQFSSPDGNGWRSAESVVTVPGGASKLCVILRPNYGELTEVLFDNLHVWRLW